jgi:hypothetical protein
MKHKGVVYRVMKVPTGWQWAVSLGPDIQIGSWESTREVAIRIAKETIEDFLSKRKGSQ